MINAIIIEDEKSSREYLMSILKAHHKNVKIIGWATDVDSGVELIQQKNPEIVFLDIQLESGSGFEVLDKFQTEMEFEVIFTTGFVDYKEKAMDYFAFYYLNKPILATELKKVLNMYEVKRSAFDRRKYEALKYQIENKGESITIFEKGKYSSVRFSNILYCEAAGSYTIVHLKSNQQLMISKNLKQVEEMLENTDFFRVHRSYLANFKQIQRFTSDGNVILANDVKLSTSARNRKRVLELLQFYHGKQY
ncbi:LytTR family two component transcriptional regulator [Kordia periserrulae]|uniref:LytTR family two component transcriptional regulator n=1 Tax=Kordia periserrulae TaxID=701523 RepID=A0A2T6BXW3_9FLAO|nr:LytTR family DNA-binding domain-containing protein [Kordia periserrulae]PTX60903.1 LytTR family two component transcriptional regulator [Kordia periserrulae]